MTKENNPLRVRATYQEKDNGWYLDIIPPIYSIGSIVYQDGTLYFKQKFDSKEQAYELANKYLVSIGIKQEIIDNEVIYE